MPKELENNRSTVDSLLGSESPKSQLTFPLSHAIEQSRRLIAESMRILAESSRHDPPEA
jgi:hypothetical protein